MKLRWAAGRFLKRPRDALRGPQARRKYPTAHLFEFAGLEISLVDPLF
jgi:hypothetical protein